MWNSGTMLRKHGDRDLVAIREIGDELAEFVVEGKLLFLDEMDENDAGHRLCDGCDTDPRPDDIRHFQLRVRHAERLLVYDGAVLRCDNDSRKPTVPGHRLDEVVDLFSCGGLR